MGRRKGRPEIKIQVSRKFFEHPVKWCINVVLFVMIGNSFGGLGGGSSVGDSVSVWFPLLGLLDDFFLFLGGSFLLFSLGASDGCCFVQNLSFSRVLNLTR